MMEAKRIVHDEQTRAGLRLDTRPARAGLAALALAGLLALSAATPARSTVQGSAPADTTTITIGSTATALAFEPDRISVKQGTLVRIRYVNESTLAHNLVIVKKDADIDVIGPAAQDASDSGYVPTQHKDRMIAYSPLASPGKTVEFTFVVPPAGEYPFACFVDGHYNMMLGTLVSRP
jgi:plastocyanin